jgi:hypothetical protein
MTKPKVGNLRKLLFFMEERQRVYLKRSAGEPWPWTQDPILQRYRFCNTYRENDKETAWLRNNWLLPYADHPNLWFAVCMFRQINWSPTLAELGFPTKWNSRKAFTMLMRRKHRGEKVYTSAYMIPSLGEKNKIKYTVSSVLQPIWTAWKRQHMEDNIRFHNFPFRTLEEAHGWFLEQYGFGPFIAYEVVTDLRHTRYLQDAPDILTWANPGPGAKRGLCRLMDLDIKAPIKRADQIKYMQDVFQWVQYNREVPLLPTLEMRDIEHSLCEYDKHQRATERILAGKTVGLESFQKPGLV